MQAASDRKLSVRIQARVEVANLKMHMERQREKTATDGIAYHTERAQLLKSFGERARQMERKNRRLVLDAKQRLRDLKRELDTAQTYGLLDAMHVALCKDNS